MIPNIGAGLWSNGIRFERLSDGSVHVIVGDFDQELTINEESWCEIVAFVSASGYSGAAIAAARNFHNSEEYAD